ncbi:MAG TPA: serine/threonine-protein kinase [Solirubrobacteraceae bacterium]|nr:serine/threonine-protein kinase [Solirubrobacteraceae bacterium]
MTDLHLDTDHMQQVLRSGEVIGARYRLDGVAGAGGMATVWRAYDERLQRPVAIKVISDALAANPAAVARFAREARTHARIQHPNLVQVYDYSVTASQPYLVMEYISGCTLSERLDRGGFSDAELHALATELLSAVACVHDHNVLHRDIKTGNVMLDKDGHARLTDFGLARLEDATQITRANEVVGTLRFLAPELIEGEPASRQSDLYALGVLLRTARGDEEAAPPLQRLITWMTQHDAGARPHDAQAVLTGLRGGQQPDTLRPPPEKPRPVVIDEPTRTLPLRNRRRYRASHQLRNRTAAVSALLITVAVIALAVLGSGGGPAPGQPAAANHTANTADAAKKSSPKTTGATNGGQTKPAGPSIRALTIDQQLEQLAGDVRRAAKP